MCSLIKLSTAVFRADRLRKWEFNKTWSLSINLEIIIEQYFHDYNFFSCSPCHPLGIHSLAGNAMETYFPCQFRTSWLRMNSKVCYILFASTNFLVLLHLLLGLYFVLSVFFFSNLKRGLRLPLSSTSSHLSPAWLWEELLCFAVGKSRISCNWMLM